MYAGRQGAIRFRIRRARLGERLILNLDDRYRDGDLDGLTILISQGTGGSFQVGPDNKVVDRIEFGLDDMRASGPELNLNTTSVATLLSARGTIPILDLAIDRVASERADIRLRSLQDRRKETGFLSIRIFEGIIHYTVRCYWRSERAVCGRALACARTAVAACVRI